MGGGGGGEGWTAKCEIKHSPVFGTRAWWNPKLSTISVSCSCDRLAQEESATPDLLRGRVAQPLAHLVRHAVFCVLLGR